MKKKISLLLCLLMTVLCFTGCAKESAAVEYDKDSIEQVTEFLIEYCAGSDETVIEQWKDMSEYEMEYQLMQAGLPLTPDSFISAMESWQAGVAECGAYLSHGDYSFEESDDGLTVSVPVEFEERDATITFEFDEKLYLDSMTIDAKYGLGEIAKKAGLNTVLGMGTVFAVLIFISLIISLFKYIPAIQNALSGKGRKKKADNNAENVTAASAPGVSEEVQAEDVTDDLELVAVISAAIAAMEGTDTDGFVVRSIRRRPSNKWNS